MKIDITKLAIVATTLLASSAVTAGLDAPIATPVMGPWTLGMMAVLIAAVAYRIKKK